MGILNMTPDSFYDGGYHYDKSPNELISKFNKCDIIDIGFESSRPGAFPLTIEEELARLKSFIPYTKIFKNKILSLDTYKPEVAEYALLNGFSMINDISGAKKKQMLSIASKFNIPIVIMHMRGTPLDMQDNTNYNNIFKDISSFLLNQAEKALEEGIKKENIILDPGIGFGKSIDGNFQIIKDIKLYKDLGYKILIGHSRKSFLSQENDLPKDRLAATLAISAYLLMNNVDILRVHDIHDTNILKEINKKLN